MVITEVASAGVNLQQANTLFLVPPRLPLDGWTPPSPHRPCLANRSVSRCHRLHLGCREHAGRLHCRSPTAQEDVHRRSR
jgi:hypothetical protein